MQEKDAQIRYGQGRGDYHPEKDHMATWGGLHLSGKPASYQDMSIPQFVYGYLPVMDSEEAEIRVQKTSHLKTLISDAQLYGWNHTRAIHGVWLNQLEQGRCTWFNKETKMQFHRTLVWHPAHSSPASTNATRTYNACQACQAWNHGLLSIQPGELWQHGQPAKPPAHLFLLSEGSKKGFVSLRKEGATKMIKREETTQYTRFPGWRPWTSPWPVSRHLSRHGYFVKCTG